MPTIEEALTEIRSGKVSTIGMTKPKLSVEEALAEIRGIGGVSAQPPQPSQGEIRALPPQIGKGFVEAITDPETIGGIAGGIGGAKARISP